MIKINYDPLLGCMGWEFKKVSDPKELPREETRVRNRKKRKK